MVVGLGMNINSSDGHVCYYEMMTSGQNLKISDKPGLGNFYPVHIW